MGEDSEDQLRLFEDSVRTVLHEFREVRRMCVCVCVRVQERGMFFLPVELFFPVLGGCLAVLVCVSSLHPGKRVKANRGHVVGQRGGIWRERESLCAPEGAQGGSAREKERGRDPGCLVCAPEDALIREDHRRERECFCAPEDALRREDQREEERGRDPGCLVCAPEDALREDQRRETSMIDLCTTRQAIESITPLAAFLFASLSLSFSP